MPTIRIADSDFDDIQDKASHLRDLLLATDFDLTRPITYHCDHDMQQTLLTQYPFADHERNGLEALASWIEAGE
jgi:hypothetical protein